MSSYFVVHLCIGVCLLVGGSLSQELIHKCVHDKVQPSLYQMLHLKDGSSLNRVTRMSRDYAAIRIHTEFDSSVTGNPTLLEVFTNPNGAFQNALDVLRNAFLVIPTISNVTFTPGCSVRIRSGQNYGQCYRGFTREDRTCGIFDVPIHMIGSIVTCDIFQSCGKEGPNGPGVAADFVLFAGSTDKVQCGDGVLAFAGVCGIDDIHFRPAAGFINICYANIQRKREDLQSDSLYNVFLHELLHAFGFTPELMKKFFHDDRGTFYSAYQNYMFKSAVVPALNSTKLVQHARKHFNCSNLSYVPLENGGGKGSASAHWEARVLHHEVLMPFLSKDYMVVSNFTWAFFEDSGWFRINYTFANSISQLEMKWGQNMGCRFVLESFSACTNRDIYPYFCNNRKGNYISCTHDRHAKGTCTNRFSGFFDECTVLLSSSTGSCLYKENSKSSSQALEVFGKRSRCFQYNSNETGCFNTLIYKLRDTDTMFYKIQTSRNISTWCIEGQYVLLSGLIIHCPPVAKILDKSSPVQIINNIPSIYCHSDCDTCSVVGDSTKCLSCKDGGHLIRVPGPCCRSKLDTGCGELFISNLQNCDDGNIRLVNGSTQYEGSVQVCINGQWSYICDNYWSRNDGLVACKQLGVKTTCCSKYGPFDDDTPILMKGLVCTGHEANLLDCYQINSKPCQSTNVAGLQCTGTCTNGDVILTSYSGQETKHKGIPVMCSNGSWAAICSGLHWRHDIADLVCQRAGYSPYGALALQYQQMQDTVYNQLTTIKFGDNCNVNETFNCQKLNNVCRQNELAGVICQPKEIQGDNCDHGEVHLSNATSGIVNICINNMWITICGNGWDNNDATVVCKSIGFNTTTDSQVQVIQEPIAGRIRAGPTLLNYVACSGTERSVLDCYFLYYPVCFKYAGVACFNSTHV